MRANKLHVDESKKERQRPAALAKGGKDRMFKEQAAGPARSGQMGKAQKPAPGPKAAKGGVRTPQNIGGVARAAAAGRTGPR
jgi:hypothetical protein